MKKFIALLLLASLLALVGCNTAPVSADNTTTAVETTEAPVKIVSTICGTALNEYTIVYSADGELNFNQNAAEYVSKNIAEITGVTLPVVLDTESESTGHEIIVGQTNRVLSSETVGAAPENATDFIIAQDGNNIILNGVEYLVGGAAYRFISEFFTGKYEDVALDSAIVSAPAFEKANNLILVIGDGMGFNTIKLDEQFVETNAKRANALSFCTAYPLQFVGNRLPNKGESVTYSASDAVTDSAAGGTALATGYKTNNSFVGISPDGTTLKNLCELAIELGKKTGVVTTDDVTGATPSAFSAHVSSRSESEEILAQQGVSKHDLIIGHADLHEDNSTTGIINNLKESLNTLSSGNNGFFLMHEEAYIDKGSHNNNITQEFVAYARLNVALRIFLEFAMYNPDTLIVLTADHETGGITLNEETGLYEYTQGDHSNANVPLYGIGYGTEELNGIAHDNTFVAKFIARQMGVSDFGNPDEAETH